MFKVIMRLWVPLVLLTVLSFGKGTTAGTSVSNQAQLDFRVGGIAQSATSNTDTFLVDRKIDVLIAVNNSPLNVHTGDSQTKLNFTVVNQGNDAESWVLSVVQSSADNFDVSTCTLYANAAASIGVLPQTVSLALDQNVTYDVGCDIPATATVGQNAEIFFVATIDGRSNDANSSDVQATVQNVYAEAASDNGDVAYNGQFSKSGRYSVIAGADVTLQKSATYSSTGIHTGTVIHYTITSTVAGAGVAEGVVVSDVIPTGSTYMPGSLKLDSTSLADPVGNTIVVNEGNMTSADTHILTFDVKID